jgi:hypothetical protein
VRDSLKLSIVAAAAASASFFSLKMAAKGGREGGGGGGCPLNFFFPSFSPGLSPLSISLDERKFAHFPQGGRALLRRASIQLPSSRNENGSGGGGDVDGVGRGGQGHTTIAAAAAIRFTNFSPSDHFFGRLRLKNRGRGASKVGT